VIRFLNSLRNLKNSVSRAWARRNESQIRFEFQKRRQDFICTHNETLSVVAMRICNPDRSTVGINRRDATLTPTALLRLSAALGIVDHLRRGLARFKSATGRTRCGELCAYFLQASSKRFDCFPNCTSNLHLLCGREECAARCKTGFVWNTYRVLT
jgi:hypothetical protein